MVKRAIFIRKTKKCLEISWLLQKVLEPISELVLRVFNKFERLADMRQLPLGVIEDDERERVPERRDDDDERPRRNVKELNLERNFNGNDLDLLRDNAYPRPNNFYNTTPENLREHLADAGEEIRSLTAQINGRNNRQNPPQDYINETSLFRSVKGTLQKYKNTINDYFRSINYVVGQGINNPNQLINRLKLLGGSIMVGNNGVVPEFTQIANYLNSLKVLPTAQLKKMMRSMKIYLAIK